LARATTLGQHKHQQTNTESVGEARVTVLPTLSALAASLLILTQGCANPGLELVNTSGVSQYECAVFTICRVSQFQFPMFHNMNV
jgi:hypothetical protein